MNQLICTNKSLYILKVTRLGQLEMLIISILAHTSIMRVHKNIRIFIRCKNCSNKDNKFLKLAVLKISHKFHHLLMLEVSLRIFYTPKITSKLKTKRFIQAQRLHIMNQLKTFHYIKCISSQLIIKHINTNNKSQVHRMHTIKIIWEIKTISMMRNQLNQ